MKITKKIGLLLVIGLSFVGSYGQSAYGQLASVDVNPTEYMLPQLKTGNNEIDKAFRIALGDYFTNIQPFEISLSDTVKPVILAGLDYDRPWTRDASINSWNAGSFITPDIAKNTLVSVLTNSNDTIVVGGQYWDAIIWVTGAWNHYLVTGDKAFLALAYEATKNSLYHFENTELNKEYNLFRGLGWSDGPSAYEGKYGDFTTFKRMKGKPSEISETGHGVPMMALSTNCLYYNAYMLAHKMSKELGEESLDWSEKALKIKEAINKHLWNDATGMYKFYIDEEEESNLQETIGNAYAMLFGVADEDQAMAILENQKVTPAGVPSGWPPLKRYQTDSTSFPRHNAVVWPQIQAFWAEAAAKFNRPDMLFHELSNLAKHANRDMQFAEIYHPYTGEIYGGIQEKGRYGVVGLWKATNRQTWSATGYIRMVLNGLLGINVDEQGVEIEPRIPEEFEEIELTNLKYRDTLLSIKITGNGSQISKIAVNGEVREKAQVLNGAKGNQVIEIEMSSI